MAADRAIIRDQRCMTSKKIDKTLRKTRHHPVKNILAPIRKSFLKQKKNKGPVCSDIACVLSHCKNTIPLF